MIKKDQWYCAECGDTDVEEKRWVNMNNNEIHGTDQTGDYWCPVCEEHVNVEQASEDFTFKN